MQTFEKKIRQFRESLEEVQPSLDASLSKKPRMQSGADNVRGELEQLNRHYMELLAEVNQRFRQLKEVYDRAGVHFPVSIPPSNNNSFMYAHLSR